MATGQKFALRPTPPGSSAAQLTVFAGASSPAETIPCIAYDGSATQEDYDFIGELRGYGGGGLTLSLVWAAATATTGNTKWQAAFRFIPDDAEDLDTTVHTYDFNTVTGAAPSALKEVSYDDITFTNGADMDSGADGEIFVLRVRRNPSDAADTMAGDALLVGIILRET